MTHSVLSENFPLDRSLSNLHATAMISLTVISLILSAIAAIASAVAVTLSTVQFLTRHRPFVGVSDLRIENYPSSSEVVATLNNWGEAVGEDVRVTIGPYTYKNNTLQQRPRERYLGELFPGQEIRLTEGFPSGVIENWALGEGDVLLRVGITYQNTVSRLLNIEGTRNYSQAQTYWVTSDSWGIMAP